jgi:hypothetical protein
MRGICGRGVFALWLWFVVTVSAHAATLNISPSGVLSAMAAVPVTLRIADTGGKAVESFQVRVNGLDATELFVSAGSVVADSPTSATLRVEYLFGPGTYDVQASLKMVGEVAVRSTAQFTVPGDDQEARKNTTLGQVQEYINRYDGYDFHRWLRIGEMSAFRTRSQDAAFQLYVDPGFLNRDGAAAAYVDLYQWKSFWTVYEEDLILAQEPQAVDSNTLWHEMIHAVSHGATLHGRPGVLTGHHSDGQLDHIHIGYAEACAQARPTLAAFETLAKRYGIDAPTPEQATEARAKWKKFVADRSRSTYEELGPISTTQIAELQSLIGFTCDVDTIMAGYLGLGYSPSYFKDVIVRIVSPSSGTETSDNQIPVQAEVVVNEPGLSASAAGFLVNSSFQMATLNGNAFSTTAVLKTGDNLIYGAVQASDGNLYASAPIAVKSSALNNRYHVRISWDKDDTDIDLHFSWSGGSTCYYSNKTPLWGSSAATSPKLDVDDTNGFGPENITIDALPGSGTYRIYVRYFSDHGNGGTTVHASVLENGVPLFNQSHYMAPDAPDWTLVEFTIP